jgi:dUTP pyrophosphatase
MEIKIKKITSNAKIPSYAKTGDGAVDLTATSKKIDPNTGQLVFGTGLSIEIPPGFVGLIFPRSSIVKTSLALSNAVGVIDSSFRGEIQFYFTAIMRPGKNYEVGDRIGQLMILPYPAIEFIEATELSTTERGSGGYGSTGK